MDLDWDAHAVTTFVENVFMQELGVSIEQLTDSADIEKDLGCSNSEWADIFIRLDGKFEIDFPEEVVENWKTFGDIKNYILEELGRNYRLAGGDAVPPYITDALNRGGDRAFRQRKGVQLTI